MKETRKRNSSRRLRERRLTFLKKLSQVKARYPLQVLGRGKQESVRGTRGEDTAREGSESKAREEEGHGALLPRVCLGYWNEEGYVNVCSEGVSRGGKGVRGEE